MPLTWASSGAGECPLSLQDAQQLALDAGFTFRGSNEAMPLARRADLQAMFEHFGVNSLSAFRHKFWHYELRPGGQTNGGKSSGSSKAVSGPALLLPGSQASSGGPAGPKSRWGVQENGGETYVGELLDGRRHGSGILLSKGERSWVLHVGRFSEGKRNGPGVVATSRGERFEGFFMDNVMWGPGQYTYAGCTAAGAAGSAAAGGRGGASTGGAGSEEGSGVADESAAAGGGQGGAEGSSAQQQQQGQRDGKPPLRASFCGMFNGRPQGRGCMAWADGSREAGQFDGNNCYLRMKESEVAGVLLVAADNASQARVAAAEAQQAALQQVPGIADRARQLFAAVAGGTAGGAAEGSQPAGEQASPATPATSA